MSVIFRRIRAFLFLVSLWSLGAMMCMVALELASGNPFKNGDSRFELISSTIYAGVLAIVPGVLFTSLFMILGRGRRFKDLSMKRVAAWGTAAAAIITTVISSYGAYYTGHFSFNIRGLLFLSAIFSLGGMGVLAIARRGKVLSGSLEDVVEFGEGDISARRLKPPLGQHTAEAENQ